MKLVWMKHRQLHNSLPFLSSCLSQDDHTEMTKRKRKNVMGVILSLYKDSIYFWVFFRFSLHEPLCAFARSCLFPTKPQYVYIWEAYKQFLLLRCTCILFLLCKNRVSLWEILSIFFFLTVCFLHDHSLFYCSITEKYA